MADGIRGQSGFWDGFLQTIPLWMGVTPFGAAYALAARAAGLDPFETMGMSFFVYAGSAQFAATALFAGGAGPLTILLTTFVVNLRSILMSASLAPQLRRVPLLLRAGTAFLIVDESYAMSVSRVLSGSGPAYLLGSGATLYLAWLTGTTGGIVLSLAIANPGPLGLDLVFPLSFFVLLIPYLRSRPAYIAAVVAACLGLATRLVIPGSWYLLIAAIGGSFAGAIQRDTGEPLAGHRRDGGDNVRVAVAAPDRTVGANRCQDRAATPLSSACPFRGLDRSVAARARRNARGRGPAVGRSPWAGGGVAYAEHPGDDSRRARRLRCGAGSRLDSLTVAI